MNEEKAREILGEMIKDNKLHCINPYIHWFPGSEYIMLDGDFDVEDLEAIAWWMKNKGA